MLRAALHGKVARWLGQHHPDASAAWREIVHRNEDLLTSSVFERLGYLAGDRGMALLFRASAWQPEARPAPEPIVEAHPWPRPGDDDAREPDWVFILPNRLVVVEAKWGWGNVPSTEQLAGQAEVVWQRWPGREIVHLAVLQSGAVAFPAGVVGGVVRWERLRREVDAERRRDDVPNHERRVLDAMLEVLDRRGLQWTPEPLASLPAFAVEGLFGPLSSRS